MTDSKTLPNEIDMGDDNVDMAQLEKNALLNQMKAQADLLGVPYASNIGLETLSERVRAFKDSKGQLAVSEATQVSEPKDSTILSTSAGLNVPADIEAQYAIFYAKQIVRVSIVCVNPAKSDLKSDLYTIFSSSIGRVSQVIPYQAPKGHHMPRCLAEYLRAKTFVGFRPSNRAKGENGCDVEHFETPEFLINDLPPLTAEEYNRIVQRQDRHVAALNLEED